MNRHLLRSMTVLATIASALALSIRVDAGEKEAGGKLQDRQFEKEITLKIKMDYLLYLPPAYGKEEKAWPLVLFLHGMGDKIERLKRGGLPAQVQKKESPFILVAPQAAGK